MSYYHHKKPVFQFRKTSFFVFFKRDMLLSYFMMKLLVHTNEKKNNCYKIQIHDQFIHEADGNLTSKSLILINPIGQF